MLEKLLIIYRQIIIYIFIAVGLPTEDETCGSIVVNIIKIGTPGTVNRISSDPPYKEWNVRLTTVSLNAFSDPE